MATESKKKISIIMAKDFYARFNKAHKTMAVTNKSEAIRILLDEAMKARGV